MNKLTKVAFVSKHLRKAYDKLGKGKFEDKTLHDFIKRAITDIRINPTCGIQLPSKLIPKEYVKKYTITNLWKYDLPNGWRLLYSIKASELLIVSVLIEWFSHKDYEKRMNYAKK